MRRRFSALWGLAIALTVLAPGAAEAAPKKGKPAAAAKAPKKGGNAKKAEPKADADAEKPDAEKAAATPDKGEPSTVKAAGTGATKATPDANASTVQETKENKEGVKTYKFGTIEVEGRLKSPQIIYFMRRVRAEFDAGLLGHRSFMRELSDTRNKSALR
jgi:hypothetical protein